MALGAVILLLLGSALAALAAEGGLRGPAAPDAPLNGSTPAGSSVEVATPLIEDPATNGSSIEDGPAEAAALTMWNESAEMDLEDMMPSDMLFENGSLGENSSSGENASLDSMSQWWRHQHHHSHSGGRVLTLFHQTSREAGHSILQSGFRPGRQGWCGGGIYFATSPQDTYHKAIGPDSHLGFMIAAKVDVGRVMHMGRHCGAMTGSKLQRLGYDSVSFNPGDGVEYVVYSKARVISMWHHQE